MSAKLIKKYEKRKGFPSFIEENPYLVKCFFIIKAKLGL